MIHDGKGIPLGINSIHPSTMKMVCDQYGVVSGYVQWLNGKKVAPFEPVKIIHFHFPNALYG